MSGAVKGRGVPSARLMELVQQLEPYAQTGLPGQLVVGLRQALAGLAVAVAYSEGARLLQDDADRALLASVMGAAPVAGVA